MSVFLGSNKVGVVSISVTSGGVVPSGTLPITQNGIVDVTEYSSVDVSVNPTLQSKTNISPTESSQTITPDNNYDALSSVQINAISPTYVGSQITRNPTITVSDNVVTIPSGYYSENQTTNVATTNIATPIVSVNTSTGLITATSTQTKGYVSSGTVSGTGQLSVQAATTITPTTSSQTAVAANKYTTGAITVAAIPSQYIIPTGSIEITTNGEVDVTQYATANVAISGDAPTYQAKTNITPTESSQTIYPDSGYSGLSSVQINAISSTYVGSGITSRSSSDLSDSGATVTVPAGYYASQASKSVTTMTLPTSTSSVATSGYTSKATVSRSIYDQYINIAPGYNSAGGYYKINAVANGSTTAPASISGSSASISTGTNTITLSKTISVTPTVSAGYISSGTAGNSDVSLSASVTTKAAATITPTTTDQTIASGTYLTGAQTIKGDANLVASNIVSGTTIFGVTGTATGGGGSGSGGNYTRTEICPSTTFSASTAGGYVLLNNSGRLEDDEEYIITFDNVEYTCHCEELYGTDRFVGDLPLSWGNTSSDYIFPFCIEDWNSNQVPLIYARDTSSHTVKIEKIEFLDNGLSLTTKTITTNGTYNASSDNADGYSSVTVAVTTTPNIDTKTTSSSNYPTSIEFAELSGQPIAWFLRATSTITVSTSSGSSYYYIIAMRYNGSNTTGDCLRCGGTRRIENITSGYSYTYSNGTLTITSSASSRTASPGAFNGNYELVYIY